MAEPQRSPEEHERERSLRLEHLGLHVPGQVLRLDLYRLVCYFHASEPLMKQSDPVDGFPWLIIRDEFQNAEIIRILLQTAVAIRYIGGGYADPLRGNREWLEDPVGKLSKNVTKDMEEPLPLREACNKIIHAKNIVVQSNDTEDYYERYSKPTIICYEDWQQQTGWKASIDVFPYAQVCDALFQQFA